ncbi:hypothetical protein GCM10023196_083240 [Actinoallomurus vinaceus]|uniref:Uncharacterized protein n=1 Tax=Actinoallomurus vinaceus TaxID=1080074 RepID=A0ABP8UP28_9ACTN
MTPDPFAAHPYEYRAIVGVDTKSFTGNPSSRQPYLSARIPEVLEEAFARSGLTEAWKDARFPQDTGDGHVIGTDPRWLPSLVSPFPDVLQEVLEEEDRRLSAVDRNLRMRLRVSIHAGLLPDSGQGLRTDGKGKPMNDAHRLLDSTPVREALKDSNPDVTLVAVIISQHVFESFVQEHFTKLHPSRLAPVEARVEGKVFAERAWLYVPKPSHGHPGDDSGDPARPDSNPPATPTGGTGAIIGNRGAVANHNTVGGSFSQNVGGDR